MQSVDVKGALCLIGRTSLVGEIRRSWLEGLRSAGQYVEQSIGTWNEGLRAENEA